MQLREPAARREAAITPLGISPGRPAITNGREISFISSRDLRINGRNFRAGEQIPVRYARVLSQAEAHHDSAYGSSDLPPNAGRMPFPHINTFGTRQSLIAKIYKNPDQAMRDSPENARAMRNDCLVMECLEARQRGTALLDWHLETEDPNNPHHKKLIDDLTRMVAAIPRFTEYRRNLLEALWYGRYAVQHQFGFVHRENKRFTTIKRWLPINGDKLLFRYDDESGTYDPDQVGIRTNFHYPHKDRFAGNRKIELTDYGPGYFLEPWERRQLAIHRHLIEDGSYEDILSAGRIHGVGIRDRIYWTWYQKQEALAMMMELVERTSAGFTIYYFTDGNKEDENRMAELARNHAYNNTILIPRMAGDPSMNANGIEQIPPNTAGVDAIKELIVEFYHHLIKRYIIGQVLTSESAATGLGSGVADLHLETFMQIIKYDAKNLEETISVETVQVIKEFNPEFNWARDIPVFFRIDTEDTHPDDKLSAIEKAWNMGARIPASAVMSLIGLAMPTEEEEVLQNPQFAASAFAGMDVAPETGGMIGGGQSGELSSELGGDGYDPENLEHLFGPAIEAAGVGGDGESQIDLSPGRNGTAKQRFSAQRRYDRQGSLSRARYEVTHAPEGGSIGNGKEFKGGQFQPQGAAAKGKQAKQDATARPIRPMKATAGQQAREAGMLQHGYMDKPISDAERGEFWAMAKANLGNDSSLPKEMRGMFVTLQMTKAARDRGVIHTGKIDQGVARKLFDVMASEGEGDRMGGHVRQLGSASWGFSGASGALILTQGANGRFSATYTPMTHLVRAGGEAGGMTPEQRAFDFASEGNGWRAELDADGMHAEQDGQDDYGPELDENDLRTWEFDADTDGDEVVEDNGPSSATASSSAVEPASDSPTEFGNESPFLREPGDDGDEDDDGSLDPDVFGPQLASSEPNPWKLKPINRRTEFGKAVVAVAEEYKLNPDELGACTDALYDMKREMAEERELLKKHVRNLTGLNRKAIDRLENSSKDYTSIPGFDVMATSIARAYPELGVGYVSDSFSGESRAMGGGFSHDVESRVWEILKEGKLPLPSKKSLIDEAAEYLKQLKKEDSRRQELEKVPFQRRLRKWHVAKYAKQAKPAKGQSGVDFDAPTRAGKPLTDAAGHLYAPAGGTTINGKAFQGGEFIPLSDLTAASEEENHALREGQIDAMVHALRRAAGKIP